MGTNLCVWIHRMHWLHLHTLSTFTIRTQSHEGGGLISYNYSRRHAGVHTTTAPFKCQEKVEIKWRKTSLLLSCSSQSLILTSRRVCLDPPEKTTHCSLKFHELQLMNLVPGGPLARSLALSLSLFLPFFVPFLEVCVCGRDHSSSSKRSINCRCDRE